jgi:hypothetical protein
MGEWQAWMQSWFSQTRDLKMIDYEVVWNITQLVGHTLWISAVEW